MGQVETVALWIGLIGSVVGIVLSIVAIVFSVHVDRRSSQLSDRTIQSLQKIESGVERSSSDTRELIKAAWDKLLGSVDRPQATQGVDVASKEIAAGIVAELRAELAALANVPPGAKDKEDVSRRVDEVVKSLQAAISAQLKTADETSRPSEMFDRVVRTLSALSPLGQGLLRGISRVHLTLGEYRQLSSGRLSGALQELRDAALLVPVVHKISDGTEEPCYYFPAPIAGMVRAAFPLLTKPPQDAMDMVRTELKAVGYPSGHGHGERSH